MFQSPCALLYNLHLCDGNYPKEEPLLIPNMEKANEHEHLPVATEERLLYSF
jgi:hypothetical protein